MHLSPSGESQGYLYNLLHGKYLNIASYEEKYKFFEQR